jgi:hypothetical protein
VSETLLYLYGIVSSDAPEPPPELKGMEGAAVRLLPAGPLAGVVSEVPAAVYADDPLNSRLDDLAWVGERGVAHEQVLDWFAERGPIIPLSLFSLHRDAERLTRRVLDDQQHYVRTLQALRGSKEWGIKVWRREGKVATAVDELSPSLQALNQQLETAPAGKRFLLEKKRETMRTEEIRSVSRRVAHEVHAALQGAASDAVVVPIPAAAEGERILLLHSAYLVEDEAFPAFQERVTEFARRYGGAGFELEFTGPWPAYHFVGENDD